MMLNGRAAGPEENLAEVQPCRGLPLKPRTPRHQAQGTEVATLANPGPCPHGCSDAYWCNICSSLPAEAVAQVNLTSYHGKASNYASATPLVHIADDSDEDVFGFGGSLDQEPFEAPSAPPPPARYHADEQ